MLSKMDWARVAALTAALAIGAATLPNTPVQAQDSSFDTYKRARAGEDGTTGTGADAGNTTTGQAERDKNGNAGTATAGEGGQATDTAGGGGGSGGGTPSEPLPANAETLEALGVLDDVTAYDLDILVGLNIPVELLPPPVDEVTAGPSDVNTGGEGTSGETTSAGETTTEGAPAGGSTTTAAEDGTGSSGGGERKRDRAERSEGEAAASGTDGGSGTEAPGG